MSHVGVCQRGFVLHNQIKLSLYQIVSVLKGQFRVLVHDFDHLRGLDLPAPLQVVEQTFKVARLTGKETSALGTLSIDKNIGNELKVLTSLTIWSGVRRYLRKSPKNRVSFLSSIRGR